MTTSAGYSDANLFPWEQWSQLPKVEREAEMKEAQKEALRKIFSQSDSVTGDGLANADTDGSPSWFHMHHDDGIQDGYLDVGADASGFDSFLLQSGSDLIAPIAEPFADAAAITDLVTGKSSPMETVADPLVAAGPLDAVQVDEPRNNDF